jgi:colicin import membrane protein
VSYRTTVALLANFEDDRERRFRRVLVWSAAVHLLLVLLVVASPRPKGTAVGFPGVVRVDLVALPAPAAPPDAKPSPPEARPAPPPPPPPAPVPEKKVLPKEPTQAAAKPVAKPVPKPAAPAPPAAQPEKEPEVGYDELLAQLRQEAGASAPASPAAGTGSAAVAGGGILVSPEVMAWMRRAKVHVTSAWVLEPGFRTHPLETEIRVRLGPSGEVLRTRITRRSGNPWFDESVERAIHKASPLPAPPEADEWPFVFRPQDVL